MTKLCQHIECRRAGQELNLNQFPKNAARPDGKHPYCRECSSRMTMASRRKVKAAKEAQKRFGLKRKAMWIALRRDPLVEVYRAIERGHQTRERIQRATHLSFDEIGDQLIRLIWDYSAVRIENGSRVLVDQKAEAAAA